MRLLEDAHFGAKWTDTVHIKLAGPRSTGNATEGVEATIALDKMHNNNGLGHGKAPDEVLVVECASGILNIARTGLTETGAPTIRVEDSVKFDSTIDNPSYFSDPFADSTRDGSAYLLAGLGRAVDLAKSCRDPFGKEPVMIWAAKRSAVGGQWETKLVFEDDGSRIRSASAAVQVAIDPAQEGGNRRAWLFVTGFLSKNVIAVKIDV
jgi:hypothetical protein